MRTIRIGIVAVFCITALQAQKRIKGNGNIITVEREVGSYDGISVNGFYQVELISGEEGKIRMEGEGNILEHIETDVVAGILTITSKNLRLKVSWGKKVFITIPIEKINSIRLSGSGKLTTAVPLTAEDFDVQTSGSRTAELALDVKKATVMSSGSSKVLLKGTAQNLKITSSGSSHLNASTFTANRAEVTSSGSSNVKLFVKDVIVTQSSGSSRVRYSGNLRKVDSKASGSSAIVKTD